MSAPLHFVALPQEELEDPVDAEPASPRVVTDFENFTGLPPGRANELARFLYGAAHRPVKEVAIVAALGWLAGVCGKAFTTPSRSGLNLYMILVARSAVGKEAMHSGIALLTDALVTAGCPVADRFVTFDRFASGPSLRKAVAQNPSFVQVNGEWGLTLKAMLSASRQPDGPLQTLKAEMTNLYQKSGPESRAGAMRYSDPKNNVDRVGSVAYSMIGETTPGTFLAAQSSDMMEDGFASRFNVVEYAGDRPPENEQKVTTPPPLLMEWCTALVLQAERINAAGGHQPCRYDADTEWLRKDFNARCDTEINATSNEALRQVWNRADLKVQKIACLLAVADNCLEPVVQPVHFYWAKWLVERDIALYQKQLKAGDVGDDDAARDRKITMICMRYLLEYPRGYGVPDHMHRDGVIARRYLQQRTSTLPAFAKHPLGARRAFDDAIRGLCDNGYLMEVDKMKANEAYGFQGKCFRIVHLPHGLLD